MSFKLKLIYGTRGLNTGLKVKITKKKSRFLFQQQKDKMGTQNNGAVPSWGEREREREREN